MSASTLGSGGQGDEFGGEGLPLEVRISEGPLAGTNGAAVSGGGGWPGFESADPIHEPQSDTVAQQPRRVVESYLSRCRVVDTIRFIMQSYQLEDIWLLRYEGLRNLVMLVLAKAYFASVRLGKRAKLVILIHHVQRATKRI